jgi:adenylate cyclase
MHIAEDSGGVTRLPQRPLDRRWSLSASRLGRWQVSLRVTLVTLLVGLLLATVSSIAVVEFVTTSRSIQELESRFFSMLSIAVNGRVQTYLEPAIPVLEEARTRAQYGRLVVDDVDELAAFLVDRLRYQKNLSWLSYSDNATGRFVGAWRDADGTIVLNQSSPAVDDGRPVEAVVGADGDRRPLYRELPGGYDPRQRGWYAQARASDGIIWTDPFEFNEGRMGITAAVAVRAPDTNQLRGVFTADFFLDDVSRFLADLVEGQPGRAAVLSRKGEVIARSYAPDATGPAMLAAGLGAAPMSLAAMRVDEPVSFPFEYGGVRYIATGQVFRVAGGLEWATAYWVPEAQFLDVVYYNQRFAAAAGLLFLAIAVGLGVLLSHRVASPLHGIARDMEQIGQFQLSLAPLPASFIKEIAVVSDAVERMKASLRSFGRYVPTELVRELLARGEEARLGGETRCLTIQFTDVESFTHISERLAPAEVVHHLAEYLAIVTSAVREHAGTLDKFMGDGTLALFNAPQSVPDHAARGCRAALCAQRRLRDLQPQWEREGKPTFRARVGLHTGDALVGNIGTPERFGYTAVGDAVNLASRLEGLNKLYGTYILASEQVCAAAGPGFEWRRLDRVAVMGRSVSTLVSELLGERGEVAPDVLRARDLYEEALEAYFARRFEEAASGFRAAAALRPDDRAARMMARRAEDLEIFQPAADWDGVHLQTAK